MSFFVTLLGLALIAVAPRDVFHTLFSPSGRGSVSELFPRFVWRRVFRRIGRRRPGALRLAGPTALLCVLIAWTALLTVGWALVFLPHLPEGFRFATGLNPSAQSGLMAALYVSMVTLTTLGYGDITPAEGWLRMLAPMEALVGFGLLTAGISWVLSIYPALSRRRSLAHQVALVRETGTVAGSPDGQTVQDLLGELTTRLISVRSDLIQFPITYYFHSTDERDSLSAAMPYLLRLARECAREDRPPGVRLRAEVLRRAIDDFCAVLASQYLESAPASSEKVLADYARDHLREPLTG